MLSFPHMTPLFLASDHAGFELKESIKALLRKQRVTVMDLTLKKISGDDYPAIGRALASRVAHTRGRGILFCGSGVGVAIAANRVRGARAVEGCATKQVKLAREHNDVNILTLGGRSTSLALAKTLVKTFLATSASTAARHKRRVKQLG